MDRTQINHRAFIQMADTIRQSYHHKQCELLQTGLSIVQMQLVHYLYDHEGCNQQAIVEMRGAKRSTVSEMLTTMEALGLIYRKKDDKDKRVTFVFLTENGKQLAATIVLAFNGFCQDCLTELSDEEVELFLHFVQVFTKKYSDDRRCV